MTDATLQMTEHQFKSIISSVVQEVVKAQSPADVYARQKHDVVGTPVGSPYSAGGALTLPGVRPGMISAIVQPRTFLDFLPLRTSRITNDIQGIFTAQSAAQGSNPADTCGTPARPGNLFVTHILNRFGTMYAGSEAVNLVEAGEMETWAISPQTIENYASSPDPLVPEPLRVPNLNAVSQSALTLYKLGTMVRRLLAKIEIDGDNSQAHSSTELGWIREFDGLSRHIVNGTTDLFVTGNPAAPAADSLVIAWSAAVDAVSGGFNLPQLMTDVYFAKKNLAMDTGRDGTVFAWVMDKRLFRSLAFVWSCVYAYTRCVTTGAGAASASEIITREMGAIEARFMDIMKNQYLPCDGDNVPVLFTSGAEVSQATAPPFTGRIFLVPMEWNGNPMTSLEYKPLDNEEVQAYLRFFGNTTNIMFTNNGMYFMSTRSSGACMERIVAAKLRLRVDYRYLAARFDGITFQPYTGYRDWDPTASSFYSGGTSFYNQYVGG